MAARTRSRSSADTMRVLFRPCETVLVETRARWTTSRTTTMLPPLHAQPRAYLAVTDDPARNAHAGAPRLHQLSASPLLTIVAWRANLPRPFEVRRHRRTPPAERAV